MRTLAAVLCTYLAGCGLAWRPALVVSVDAVHAQRTLEPTGVSAARWDLRAEASLVLAPRAVRPRVLRDAGPRGARRSEPPCLAGWLCAWERAAREEAIAGTSPALLEEAR